MATPAEIVERHERKERLADDPPDGFIKFHDRWMGVWLPDGETPESIGLTTFVEEVQEVTQ